MAYDFDKILDRSKTDSLKWDIKEGELPMWVADMDFETAPEIMAALQKRAEHGAFGYTIVPDEWYDAITGWWKKRHELEIEKDWLLFCTGVIPAISSIVRKLTTVGENIVVQPPVYNIFYNSILNNGRHVLENPLHYEGGVYTMDFEDLEKKLSDPQTRMMILCNPQNPAGKIWDADTLRRVGDLCAKYDVYVLVDEIHCDLTAPGKDYVPFISLSETNKNNCVMCIAPTKTFNLAGLQTSAIVVPNPRLRHLVNRGINTDEVAEPNAFAVTAAITAFTQGEAWLDELRAYIENNRQRVDEFLKQNLPQVKLVAGDATYLLWLDVSEITDDSERLAEHIREKTGLFLSAGSHYHGNGNLFLRLNVACPKALLEDGLQRLVKGVSDFAQ